MKYDSFLKPDLSNYTFKILFRKMEYIATRYFISKFFSLIKKER